MKYRITPILVNNLPRYKLETETRLKGYFYDMPIMEWEQRGDFFESKVDAMAALEHLKGEVVEGVV